MPTWMNSNAAHNVLNMLIVVIGASESFQWSAMLGPVLALQVVAGLATTKLVINAIRDGLMNIFKPQPPVVVEPPVPPVEPPPPAVVA